MDLENVCGKDGGAKYFYEQAKHPLKIPWSAEHRGQGGFISVGSFANPQIMDYGHTMAKSLILWDPNSNIWDVDIKTKFFL